MGRLSQSSRVRFPDCRVLQSAAFLSVKFPFVFRHQSEGRVSGTVVSWANYIDGYDAAAEFGRLTPSGFGAIGAADDDLCIVANNSETESDKLQLFLSEHRTGLC